MKEATGELSTTVITVVAIAAISTLFIVFLYPQLKASVILNQACGNGSGGYGFDSEGTKVTAAPSGKVNKGYKVYCAPKTSTSTSWTCTYADTSGIREKTCQE